MVCQIWQAPRIHTSEAGTDTLGTDNDLMAADAKSAGNVGLEREANVGYLTRN